ncbi:MAG: lysophospholipase [Spirochaetia bacterium]
MHTNENNFLSFDGTTIFYRSLEAEGPEKAVCLILHGLHEHSERYIHVMEEFSSWGISTYAPDHRGHGRTAKTMGHIESFQKVRKDIIQLTEYIRNSHPEKPLFILGHSMGGLLTLYTLEETQDLFTGAILSGAAMDVAGSVPGIMKSLSGLLAAVLPLLPVQELDTDNATKNRKMVKESKSDPFFNHGKVRAKTGAEMLKTMDYLKPRLKNIKTPVLILQGTEDVLVPTTAAELIFREIGSEDKKKKLFDGLYHELLNEPERGEVFAIIQQWIEKRTAGS